MKSEKSERDTHFAGFAELLWSELYEHISEQVYFGESPHEYLMHKIIAQRAFDLVKHVIKKSSLDDIAYLQFINWDANDESPMEEGEIDGILLVLHDIPDLDEWPE